MSKSKIHPPADHEIAQLQQRIYLHRIGLSLSIEATKQALRERLASRSVLLGAGATGFILGLLTKRRHASTAHGPQPQPSATSRGFSVLAEAVRTGLKFLQSGPGLWLAGRLASRAADREPEPEARPDRTHQPSPT